MHTPARAARAARTSAEPFPPTPALKALEAYGFRPRSGQMLMIAGQSGCGKSRLALWWTAMLGQHGWDTLYFAADSDPNTMTSRLIALATGVPASVAAEDPQLYIEAVADAPITFCFDTSPTIDGINEQLDAYVEVWDRYPRVIVIDNLMDLDTGDESHQGLLYAMKEIHALRQTQAAVIVLHHTLEGREGASNRPQPSNQIANKLSQKPEQILTIADDPELRSLWVAPVKNRNGPSDRTGKTAFRLSVDPHTGLFSQPIPTELIQ